MKRILLLLGVLSFLIAPKVFASTIFEVDPALGSSECDNVYMIVPGELDAVRGVYYYATSTVTISQVSFKQKAVSGSGDTSVLLYQSNGSYERGSLLATSDNVSYASLPTNLTTWVNYPISYTLVADNWYFFGVQQSASTICWGHSLTSNTTAYVETAKYFNVGLYNGVAYNTTVYEFSNYDAPFKLEGTGGGGGSSVDPNLQLTRLDYESASGSNLPKIIDSLLPTTSTPVGVFPVYYPASNSYSYTVPTIATSSQRLISYFRLHNVSTSTIRFNVAYSFATSTDRLNFSGTVDTDYYSCGSACNDWVFSSALPVYDSSASWKYNVKQYGVGNTLVADNDFIVNVYWVSPTSTATTSPASFLPVKVNCGLYSVNLWDDGVLQTTGILFFNAMSLILCPSQASVDNLFSVKDNFIAKTSESASAITGSLTGIAGTGSDLSPIVFTTNPGSGVTNPIPALDIPILDLTTSAVGSLATALYPYETFGVNLMLALYLYGLVKVKFFT